MKVSFLQRGPAVVAALVCLAANAFAAPTVDIKGTDAIIQYTVADDLSNLPLFTGKHASGVKVAGFESTIKNRTHRLTVKSGALDIGTGAAQVFLSGGLVYTRKTPDRSYKVILSDLIVDLTFNTTTAPGIPDPVITFGGAVTAIVTVDGKVLERMTVWNLDDVVDTYFFNIPVTASYKKVNLSLGAVSTAAAAGTVIFDGLGQPDGFDAGATPGDFLLRLAFKAQ